ncbi:hypothetical protein, partial [Escherichia coli]|uniref:hypothetical protein n=1 Tax=Escherichia coli TaxID=562 RepID=UPI00307A4921
MTKPEASGRIAKWAIELGEHDISFCPRQAIKGQALADFLAEANFVEKPKPTESVSDDAEAEPMVETPRE